MPKIKAPRRYKYVVNRVSNNPVTTTSKEKNHPPIMAPSPPPPPPPPASTKATPAVEKEQPRPAVPRFSFTSLISGIENKVPPKTAPKPNVGPLSPPSSNDRTPKGPLSPPRDKTTLRPATGPSVQKCKANPLSPRAKTPPLVLKRSLGEAAAKIGKSKIIKVSKAKSLTTTTPTIAKKKTDGSGCNNSTATAISTSTTKTAATAIKAVPATTAAIKINIKARKYTSNESSPITTSTTTTTAATTPNNDIKTKKSATATDINTKAKKPTTSDNSPIAAVAVPATGTTTKAKKLSSSLTATTNAAKNTTTSVATITNNKAPNKVLTNNIKRNRTSNINKNTHADDLPSPAKTGTNKRPRSSDIIEVVDLESLPLPSFKKVRTQPSAPGKPAVPRLNIKPLKQRPAPPNPLRVDMSTTPRPAMAQPLHIPDFAKPRREAGVAQRAGEPYLGPLSERFGTSMRDMMGPQWAIAPEGAVSKQYWGEGAR